GAAAVAVLGDLTDPATIDTLAREVQESTDRLEVLVSNAGAYPRIAWNALDLDSFREQIEINLVTHAACAKLVTPALTARLYGRIVAVSSVLTQLGRVDLAAYIAAKSGLEGLVRAPGPRTRTVRRHRQLRSSGIHRGARRTRRRRRSRGDGHPSTRPAMRSTSRPARRRRRRRRLPRLP